MSTILLAPEEPIVTTNQHFSVDADGRKVVDLSFQPEGIGLPAEKGYGWAQLEFGEKIGYDQRYTIARKLGWGKNSSTWLAWNEVLNKYVAVKVLTGHATDLHERKMAWEEEALKRLTFPSESDNCVHILEYFTMKGRGSAGSHLCFTMPLYGGDVRSLIQSRTSPFPLPLVKRILLHLLRGIAFAHERGIVHTDLKFDNVLFTTPATTSDIEKWIQEDPPRRNPPELSSDGVLRSAVSQPMKLPSEEEALRATYVLADFGCALPSKHHANCTITPILLRAPEVLLGGEWDTPADMWSFGCLAYELITNEVLFRYRTLEVFDLTEDENLLYQMMIFSCEVFHSTQLNVCPLAGEYFNPDCQLKKAPPLGIQPIHDLISQHKVMPDAELRVAGNFIQRCLCLKPEDRATAEDLLEDEWLQGIE
ncbi:hypothetical protein PLEOSDRAFT_159843 [Pleurotus ostreatus PC15]|uniref:Protein kinase domain-containing protein n=1 Tax=Pleurotus ostreatus (strain PC15) TaxID=1137138 RepID=A0A067NDZ1_PLEO1|nr:hypothetical protein PLEOSDRAFT_159843 [Pleurotus ostreatus PC15]